MANIKKLSCLCFDAAAVTDEKCSGGRSEDFQLLNWTNSTPSVYVSHVVAHRCECICLVYIYMR